MQKLLLVTCKTPHKMRSAQTPFGAWAIMKNLSYMLCYPEVLSLP